MVTGIGVFAVGIVFTATFIGIAIVSIPVIILPDPPISERDFWSAALAIGLVIALPFFAWSIRKTIREERRQLLDSTVSVSETTLEDAELIEALLRRLATQFDVPESELRIHPATTPLAYTTYRPDDPILRTRHMDRPVVVVSEGLVAALSREEIGAVLAHELAHLTNDDLHLITWVLVPLVAAEQMQDDEITSGDLLGIVGWILASIAAIGVGFFSRGREMAADRGAVAVMGEPMTLAAALSRLDDSAPAKPTEDLRKHARSMNAVNVLPTLGPDGDTLGLRATHPPIDIRIEQLRSLAQT